MTSGGFEANLDWLRRYWGDAVDNYVIRGTPYNDGRVLANLLDKGAATAGDPKGFHAVALDARSPKFDGGIATRLDSVPFGIAVNKHGKRFYDEGEDFWPKRYAIWGRSSPSNRTSWRTRSSTRARSTAFSRRCIDRTKRTRLARSLRCWVWIRTVVAADGARVQRVDRRRAARSIRARWTAATRRVSIHRRATGRCRSRARRSIGYPLRPGITFTYLGLAVDTLLPRADGQRRELWRTCSRRARS